MTWVKICGITNLEDAQAAVAAGADAVGFVFGESKRRVSAAQAAQIAADLPAHVERVGVFVNESPDVVRQTVRTAQLTTVQLQGDEDSGYLSELSKANAGAIRGQRMRIVKALSVGPTLEGMLREFSRQDSGVDAVLFDSGNAEERGGTGRVFPWGRLAAILGDWTNSVRVIVAGGLNPGNVAEAIATLHPWGVDVVSGTESAPGKKDPEKMKAFVAAVREADKPR